MAVHAPASRGVAGRWWHGVLLAVVVPALGADAEGFASSAACLCDLEDPGAPPALLDFAREAHCWHAGRKIPPSLYASAHALYSALADSAPESSAAGQLPIASCAPGIFTALLVLLTLWEAHDAPEQLVGTVLPHALALNARYFSGVEEDIDCRGAGPSWPGRVPLMDFHRLHRRLARKAAAWQHIADFGTEPWHPREVAEARLGGRAARGLCLCLMHGEGAATLNATLASYQEGGLLRLASRRFLAFLAPPEGAQLPDEVSCWRERLVRRYGLEVVDASVAGRWPDPFIRKRQRHGTPGAAMVACAAACDAEHILFLEDDWQLVTRPRELVRHRVHAAMEALAGGEWSSSPSGEAPLLGVHLRHKLFFGPPFYEMLTAAQHNEPPSPYAAWYFSDDPVEARFPDDLWAPPFWDSKGGCDSQRASWLAALEYQRHAAESFDTRCSSFSECRGPAGDADDESSASESLASRVWWCSDGSSLLCASTAAHRDPFRSLMFSTNPTLYRTDVWRLHLASYMAVLQDLRAVEEAVSSSFMWRVRPTFNLGLSIGLFRHRRLDREHMPSPEEDVDAAECVAESAAEKRSGQCVGRSGFAGPCATICERVSQDGRKRRGVCILCEWVDVV